MKLNIEYEKQIQELKEEIKNKDNEIKKKEELISTQKLNLNVINKSKEILKNELDSINEDVIQKKVLISDLKNDVKQLKTENENMNAELLKERSKKMKLNNELSCKDNRIKELIDNSEKKIYEYKESINQMKEKIKKSSYYIEQIENLKKRLNECQINIDDYYNLKILYSNMKNENTALHKENEELIHDINEKKKNIEELVLATTRARALETKYNCQVIQINELKKQLDESSKELSDLQVNNLEFKKLKNIVPVLKSQIESQQKEINNVHSKNREQEELLTDLNSLKKTNEKQKQRIEEIQNLYDESTQKLISMVNIESKFNQKEIQLNKIIKDQELQITELRSKLENLQITEKEHQQLKDNYNKLNSQTKDLKSSLKISNEKVIQFKKKEIEYMLQEKIWNQDRNQLKALKDNFEKIKDDYCKLNDLEKELQDEIENKNKEIYELKNKILENNRTIQNQKDKITLIQEEWTTKGTTMEIQIMNLKNHLNKKVEENERLEKNNSNLLNKFNELSNKTNELEKMISKQNLCEKQYKEQIKQLEASLNNTSNDLIELNKRYHSSIKKIKDDTHINSLSEKEDLLNSNFFIKLKQPLNNNDLILNDDNSDNIENLNFKNDYLNESLPSYKKRKDLNYDNIRKIHKNIEIINNHLNLKS